MYHCLTNISSDYYDNPTYFSFLEDIIEPIFSENYSSYNLINKETFAFDVSTINFQNQEQLPNKLISDPISQNADFYYNTYISAKVTSSIAVLVGFYYSVYLSKLSSHALIWAGSTILMDTLGHISSQIFTQFEPLGNFVKEVSIRQFTVTSAIFIASAINPAADSKEKIIASGVVPLLSSSVTYLINYSSDLIFNNTYHKKDLFEQIKEDVLYEGMFISKNVFARAAKELFSDSLDYLFCKDKGILPMGSIKRIFTISWISEVMSTHLKNTIFEGQNFFNEYSFLQVCLNSAAKCAIKAPLKLNYTPTEIVAAAGTFANYLVHTLTKSHFKPTPVANEDD